MRTNRYFLTFSSYLPWVLAIGAMIVIASDVIAIILNPDYNPSNETISDLVHYPYSWITTMGMTIISVMHMLLAVNALSSPASHCHRLIRFAGILLAVISLGFVVIMVFHTDPGEEIISLAGRIHVVIAATVSIIFPIACGSLTIALWHHRKSEILIIFSAIITIVSLFIAWQVMPQNETIYIGTYERLLALVNLSWFVMAGFRLPRLLGNC
jgi:hypothetical protein